MSKRRGKGEGSLHQRSDGTWAAVLELPPANGKRRRKWIYGPDKATVKIALARVQLAIAAGEKPKTRVDRTTVGEYLDRWLDGAEVKPRTLESYRWIVEKHLKPHIGDVALREFGPSHAEYLKAIFAKNALGARTRQLAFVVLRVAMNHAIATRAIVADPLVGIRTPRYERGEMESWDAEQARRVLEAAQGDRFFALYVVALRLGLQFPGEILGLRWSDLDLKARTLSIETQVNAQRERGSTKRPSRRRRLELPRQVVDALVAHREQLFREGLRSSEFVFPNKSGGQLMERNFRRDSYEPVILRSGVPRIRPYGMRHTFASLALLAGVHPKVVSEILGHANVIETLRTYSHVLPTMQRDAIDRLDVLWDVAASLKPG